MQTYYPTEEDWLDMAAYISKVERVAKHYGICKIVPPPSWNPGFSMPWDFEFGTKRQEICKLKEGAPFKDGKRYNLTQYKLMAEQFSKLWEAKEGFDKTRVDDTYWSLVEAGLGSVIVEYGSDIQHTSGFPVQNGPELQSRDMESHEEGKDGSIASSPWNLNNIPRSKDSLLEYVQENVAGVTSPWVYAGMLFSTFCFHVEDNWLYSLSYNHMGAAKRWYAIPAKKAEHFEGAIRDLVPELYKRKHSLFLQALLTMVSPATLQSKGVEVFEARQEPGEFIVTFPRAYHGGFNEGFNVAEAVNYAPPTWLPYGLMARNQYARINRKSAIILEELCLIAAERRGSATKMAWIAGFLKELIDEEESRREQAMMHGCKSTQQIGLRSSRWTAPDTCCMSNADLQLSAIACKCNPRRLSSLPYAWNMCTCPMSSRVLLYSEPIAGLMQKYQRVLARSLRASDEEKKRVSIAVRECKEHFQHHKKCENRGKYLAKRSERLDRWCKAAEAVMQKPTPDRTKHMLRSAEEFEWGPAELEEVRCRVAVITRYLEKQNRVRTTPLDPSIFFTLQPEQTIRETLSSRVREPMKLSRAYPGDSGTSKEPEMARS
eukprot:scaffold7207_cov520-Prasinococcus_capsulatus_cf.AAC.3